MSGLRSWTEREFHRRASDGRKCSVAATAECSWYTLRQIRQNLTFVLFWSRDTQKVCNDASKRFVAELPGQTLRQHTGSVTEGY